MKFVHIADIHFDSPFVNLSDKDMMGDLRRLEQRKVFKKVIEYIKENDIKYLFISGDLYEHKYIKLSTIEYINNLFKEIPETMVFISPGNHDPFIKNSYYNTYNWNSNVKIFNSEIEKVELEDCNIYGYGFDDFYCSNSGIENIEIHDKEKSNMLVIHGTLEGKRDDYMDYNTLKRKQLENIGFDYIALGHIHKKDYNSYENQKIVYPGSLISLGFDELGQHGMIVGELSEKELNLKFVPLDESEFVELEFPVTDIISKEELIEKINDIKIQDNKYVKLILTGKRNFEINIYELNKLIFNEKIIKLKDKTRIKYDLEKIANDNTLKGIFAKKMLDKMNKQELSDDDVEILEKAVEIGFQALE